jgi:hypothetical protein
LLKVAASEQVGRISFGGSRVEDRNRAAKERDAEAADEQM